MDTTQAAVPVSSAPPAAKMPAFHRAMRTIVTINILAALSFLPFGWGFLLFLLLAVCASFVILLWTLYAVLRSNEPKVGPTIAIALVIYFCANALCAEYNPFVPNDPRPRTYEGAPATWAAFEMLAILMGVWAFRIWNDFKGVFSRIRAITAAICSILFWLLCQNGPDIDEGKRRYDSASEAYSRDPKSIGNSLSLATDHLQKLRRTQDQYSWLLIYSTIGLAAISWFPRWRPCETKTAP